MQNVSAAWKRKVKLEWYLLREPVKNKKKTKNENVATSIEKNSDSNEEVTIVSENSSSETNMQLPNIILIPNLPPIKRWIPVGQNFIDEGKGDLENEENIEDNEYDDDEIGGNASKNMRINEEEKMENDIPLFDDTKFMKMVQNLTKSYYKRKSKNSNPICKGHTVRKHNREWYRHREKTKSFRRKNEDRLPPNFIFKAISCTFPNTRTENGFKEKYINLLKVQRLVHNIDGIYAEDVSPKATLHSFQTLFCRRCLYYDCILHRNESEHIRPNVQKKQFPEMKPFEEPCGDNCFMLLKKFQENPNYKTNANAKVEPSTSSGVSVTDKDNFLNTLFNDVRKVTDGQCLWTGSDRSTFRALVTVFKKNYCAIAQILITKTCQEVYEFAQNVNDVEETFKENDEPPSNQHNKEQNNSQNGRIEMNPSSSKLYSRYIPCDHPGDCNHNCPCVRAKTLCEKFCNCTNVCNNRYRGCRCKTLCNKKHCSCFWASRECDPDLCVLCSGAEIDPKNINCKNVNIQRRLRKQLLWAPSDVSGWGIFIKDHVEKNEFISEYCGELISHNEAERRGSIYNKEKCSYLFDLNNAYVIDAYKYGGKMRFANHSDNPNCYAKVLLVNGDHRVGIFAKRDIEPGEELFFDYSYGLNERLQFLNINDNIKN